ncbi:hypothetical protein D9757_008121 [Collybiopsis confluens]|uniref:Uncharacterized protein n=1 Tax=Collybiopsis confluens TaxID=2823264 RepID=A0A8H5HE52_9AGAR|nr:hypothetical protein D9757_008121 [Collybiopsis confluens]
MVLLFESLAPDALKFLQGRSHENGFFSPILRCSVLHMSSVRRGRVSSIFRSFFFLSLLLLSGFVLDHINAAPINTTFDDTHSAFSFVGIDWNSITPNHPCGQCSSTLDPSLTYNSSWHDGSSVGLTGTFQFEGSAVFLYGITGAAQTGTMAFTVDDGPSINNPNLDDVSQSVQHVYNTLLFSSSGLSNDKHTLSWKINAVDSPAAFAAAAVHVTLIDYAVVTSDIPDPSSSNTQGPVIPSTVVSTTTSTIRLQDAPSTSDGGHSDASSSSVIPTSNSTLFTGTTKTSSAAIPSNSSALNSSSSASTSIAAVLGTAPNSTSNPAPTASPNDSSGSMSRGTSQSHVRLIVGAAVGGTAGAAVVLCIILFIWRKRYLAQHHQTNRFRLILPEDGGPRDPHRTEMLYPSEKSQENIQLREHEPSRGPVEAYMDVDSADETEAARQIQEAPRQIQQTIPDIDPVNNDDANADGRVQGMEQRIAMLEMLLQPPIRDRPVPPTPPPPY